jgi:FtsP/CotA-like multicopper oxidase with cupredoxin domain
MIRHPRALVAVAATMALTLLGAACSSSGNSDAGGSGTGGQASSQKVTIDVSLEEWAIAPSQIQAPSRQTLVFNVTNQGTTQHTFAVAVPDATPLATQMIEPGQSATLEVPALEAGSYRVYCSVPGHADLGMSGQLVVAEGSASGGTPEASGSMGVGDMGQMAGGTMTAEEMAKSHEAGVKAFPAKTEGTGNEVLQPTLDKGVKVFQLTATEVRWEVSPGVMKDGMAFNGEIPGPEIQVQQGDRVRFVVQNQMTQPTVVHFHGMTVPNKDDGVPYITQDPIMPGGYFVYEFTVKDPPGMYVYHSHFNSTEQVGKGLYGSIIVEPKGGRWIYPSADIAPQTGLISYGPPPKVNDEYTLFLGDGPLGYVLNGKSFPATQPFTAKRGDWVLIHIANDGSMLHPMHLHGYHFEVVAQDGYPLKDPYMADTLVVAPGQRFDILVHAVYPGAWAFHCHILPHVEGPAGMFGMVTALIVE